MENVEKPVWGRFVLPVFTTLEWLMVLPATVFLAAAAFRGLQPVQYEPARTCAAIVAWTVAHVSRSGATILFLGMPGLVVSCRLRDAAENLAEGCGVAPGFGNDDGHPAAALRGRPVDGCRAACGNRSRGGGGS